MLLVASGRNIEGMHRYPNDCLDPKKKEGIGYKKPTPEQPPLNLTQLNTTFHNPAKLENFIYKKAFLFSNLLFLGGYKTERLQFAPGFM
jgi:hypothetical protein